MVFYVYTGVTRGTVPTLILRLRYSGTVNPEYPGRNWTSARGIKQIIIYPQVKWAFEDISYFSGLSSPNGQKPSIHLEGYVHKEFLTPVFPGHNVLAFNSFHNCLLNWVALYIVIGKTFLFIRIPLSQGSTRLPGIRNKSAWYHIVSLRFLKPNIHEKQILSEGHTAVSTIIHSISKPFIIK